MRAIINKNQHFGAKIGEEVEIVARQDGKFLCKVSPARAKSKKFKECYGSNASTRLCTVSFDDLKLIAGNNSIDFEKELKQLFGNEFEISGYVVLTSNCQHIEFLISYSR